MLQIYKIFVIYANLVGFEPEWFGERERMVSPTAWAHLRDDAVTHGWRRGLLRTAHFVGLHATTGALKVESEK